MPQAAPYKYYKYSVNGQEYVEAGPEVPRGANEISFSEFVPKAKAMPNPENGWTGQGSYYDMLSRTTPQAVQQGGATQYYFEDGAMKELSQVGQQEKFEAEVAAGRMKKVPVGTGFGYIPTDSAAAEGLANPASLNTASNGAPGGAQGFGPGLGFDPDQALGDIYASRSDLQELYGSDGRAINPEDPRVAGIPTILDWVQKFGQNEYPVLQGYVGTPGSGGTGTGSGGGSGGNGGYGAGGATGSGGTGAGGASPYSTGDPTLDGILQRFEKYIADQTAAGNKFNPNIELDPATVQKFLDQATGEIEPYYQNQIKVIKDNLSSNLSDLQKSYELNKKQSEAQFKTGLATKRENLAGSGLAFSGVRGQQEKSAVDAASLEQEQEALSTTNKLRGALQDAESKIGSRNLSSLQFPNMTEFQATAAGEGGFTAGRTLNFAPVGDVTGSIEYNQRGDIRQLSDYLQGQEVAKRSLNF